MNVIQVFITPEFRIFPNASWHFVELTDQTISEAFDIVDQGEGTIRGHVLHTERGRHGEPKRISGRARASFKSKAVMRIQEPYDVEFVDG